MTQLPLYNDPNHPPIFNDGKIKFWNGQYYTDVGAGVGSFNTYTEMVAAQAAGTLPAGSYRVGAVCYIYDGVNPIYQISKPNGLGSYIGQVATRCGSMMAKNAGNWYSDGRSVHVATEDLTAIKVIHPNWYVDPTTRIDTGTGGVASITSCTIEYPANTFTRVTYAGINGTSIADGGNSNPDWCYVNIPKGALFGVRYHANFPTNLPSAGVENVPITSIAAFYEGARVSNGSDIADQTTSTTPTYNSSGLAWKPMAIVGMTTRPSVFICGDSIARGISDAIDYTLKQGFLERAIPYGIINVAKGSEWAGDVAAGNAAKRMAFSQYCSHIIANWGTNDIAGSQPASTVNSNYTTIYNTYFIGKPMAVCSLLPRTTGTWDTAAAQTVMAYDAVLSGFNDIVLTGSITGQAFTIDTHEIFSDAYALNKWKAFGTTPTAITSDGIHPNHKGNVYAASKVNLNNFLL